MESGSSHNSSESMKPLICEVDRMQKLHDEKLMRIEELKGKREAMMVEVEKQEKKNEKAEKMKCFKDLTEKYNSSRDELFKLLAQRSGETNNK